MTYNLLFKKFPISVPCLLTRSHPLSLKKHLDHLPLYFVNHPIAQNYQASMSTNDDRVLTITRSILKKNFIPRTVNALLLGTDCITAHIVPVVLTTPKEMSASLDDVALNAWINLYRLQPAWLNLDKRRHRFANFSGDDWVATNTSYVTYFEEQPVTVAGNLKINNYLRKLKGGKGQPWYGNMLVFKCEGHDFVKDIERDDIALAKRCASISSELFP